MMVMDCIASFGIDGKETEHLFDEIGITASKSTIPDDPQPPYKPSGIRLGTPAMTSRGMVEEDIKTLVDFMMRSIEKKDDETALKALHEEVKEFCLKFPVPGIKVPTAVPA